MSIKSAKLGTFIGVLPVVHTIECRGEEHMQKLHKQGDYNKFISFPTLKAETWSKIMAVHPKTLACSVTTLYKAEAEQMPEISDSFNELTNEILENGRRNGALHHKIRSWHADNSIADVGRSFSEGSVSNILMPTQSYLNEIDKDYSRDVDSVRKEIWSAVEGFRRLMDDKDTSYKSKQLPEFLDVYSRFHSLEYRGAE
jgi:hypothetical protein